MRKRGTEMVTIIDRTLTTLNTDGISSRDLNHFCDLLFTCGVTKIELTPELVSRLSFPDSAAGLKQWLQGRNFFLTQIHSQPFYPSCPSAKGPKPLWKLEPNQLLEKALPISQTDSIKDQKIRLMGLADLMTRDYPGIFKALLNSGAHTLDLCPGNQKHCATAIALEWIFAGGSSISCGFSNHHDLAPLEEVLMGLKLRDPSSFQGDLSVLKQLRILYQSITRLQIPKMKAIIGEDIFKVESGVHVDGVLKNPKIYEPFNPQTVGNQREIVLGKHSGQQSVLYKLKDQNLSASAADSILKQIKKRCARLGRNLSDWELHTLAREVENDDETKIYC